MTAGMRRPARGALLTVEISRSESAEWPLDAELREAVKRDCARRARERGRRYFEIYDATGARLHVGEAP
jgi:hypothetical protein